MENKTNKEPNTFTNNTNNEHIFETTTETVNEYELCQSGNIHIYIQMSNHTQKKQKKREQ